ncbi:MAG: hypothetical protein ABIS28_16680, partial [Caldimonas sp.]
WFATDASDASGVHRKTRAVVMNTVWIYSHALQPQEFSVPNLYRQGYKPSRLQMPKWMRRAWAWL